MFLDFIENTCIRIKLIYEIDFNLKVLPTLTICTYTSKQIKKLSNCKYFNIDLFFIKIMLIFFNIKIYKQIFNNILSLFFLSTKYNYKKWKVSLNIYLFTGIGGLSLKYYFVFIFTQLIVMICLAGILFGLSKVLSKKIFNLDKKSAYECGFEPFLILTSFIEISFILVAFIFLIFDLELIFLAGFLAAFGTLGSKGILLAFSYLSTVWGMVLTEIITGILGWPRWVEYNFENNSEALNIVISEILDLICYIKDSKLQPTH